MIPVILAVHIEHGKWVDVPITPDTSCRDVVECCREPSEEICQLIQTVGLHEHVVPEDIYMMDLLRSWGPKWPSVTFHLQYKDPVNVMHSYGPRPFSPNAINGINDIKESRNWHRKLPESTDLSLADLRQMAARQQHQIEAHQQLLVAKEQRLKFLKQQEARQHHPGQGQLQEGDRIRYLRERVELQELKLRRLRALRGQVEQHKANNSNLGAELESIRALFNEKEKELSMAVAKVEELTRQLEDVRRGDINGLKQGNTPSAAALEFQKLKRELLYRSKLNEQQNARIAQQRETLARRQSEISQMDQRIAELQQRLQRKRTVNQQLSSQIHVANRNRPRNNIATVEPLKRTVQDVELIRDDLKVPSDTEFTPNKKDPKYQTLPYNTKFPGSSNNQDIQKNHVNGTDKLDEKPVIQNGGPPPYHEPPSVHSPPIKPPPPRTMGALSPRPFITTTNSGTSLRGSQQRLIPTTSTLSTSSNSVVTSQPKPNPIGPPSVPRSKTPVSVSNHQVVLPPTVMTSGHSGISRTIPQTPARQHQPPSYNHVRLRGSENSNQKPVVPPKPGTPSKPVPPPRQLHGVLSNLQKPESVDQALSVLKGDTRTGESHRHITPPPPPSTSLQQRLQPSVYQHLHHKPTDNSDSSRSPNTDSDARSSPQSRLPVNGISSHTPESNNIHISINRKIGLPPNFYRPENHSPLSDINGDTSAAKRRPFLQDEAQFLNLELTSSESDAHSPKGNSNSPTSLADKTKDHEIKLPPPDSPPDHSPTGTTSFNSSSLSPDSTDRSVSSDMEQFSDKSGVGTAVRRVKKGNLKTKGAVKNSRRVSFDPLALLLDAALEGELELVKKTAKEVPNPSAANDEGITALHNAICAGHLEIVKFLVEFGCDVNAQDSDGWTPLHCAASCNNLAMVKYLVERGACIFATTLSDHETAAEKCEEDEEGFDGCSEYLYSMQEKLGILNNGVVYALYDYDSQNSDELSFRDGDQLLVLRKGDDLEREWWWSKLNDHEGYIPRNLLGLHPRVTAKKDSQ